MKCYTPKLFPSFKASLDPPFHQDIARNHVAKTVRDFCSPQAMQLPLSAYSLDMSPIEQVWDLIGRRLVRDPHPAASKDELWLPIQAIWDSFPQTDIQNLFDSMPRRIAALTAALGGYGEFGYFVYIFLL